MRRRPLSLTVAALGTLLLTGCGTQIGITASPDELFVEVGSVTTLNILAVLDIGSPTATSGDITVTSRDEMIATTSGLDVGGVSEGTVTLDIAQGEFTTTATVTVVAAGTLPRDIVVTPTSINCTTDSEDIPLDVFAILSSGVGEDIKDIANFASSDSSVALVTGEGTVVCVGEGTSDITVTHLGVTEVVRVTVGPNPPTSVTFSFESVTCAVGDSTAVQVLATDASGTTTDATLSARFSTSNSNVALASQGVIQCIAEGTTQVVADVLGVTASIPVTVTAPTANPDDLVELRIVPAIINCSVSTATVVSVIAEFGDGATTDVTGSADLDFSSSNTGVAVAFQGQILCVAEGQATIQATNGTATGTATVSVR